MSKEVKLGRSGVAVVDDCDYDRVLNGGPWFIARRRNVVYAASNNPRLYLHRYVLSLPPRLPVVDHIDGDGLNNIRSNLRIATQAHNLANIRGRGGSSTYKGVTFRKDTRNWQASISVSGVRIHLGLYTSEIDAALAYDQRALLEYGSFALLNFPKEV